LLVGVPGAVPPFKVQMENRSMMNVRVSHIIADVLATALVALEQLLRIAGRRAIFKIGTSVHFDA
jgi:hypothetical protein